MMVVQGESDLFEIVRALRPVGGFANLLHGRQQQGDQNRDDGNYDEQLDKREGSSSFHGACILGEALPRRSASACLRSKPNESHVRARSLRSKARLARRTKRAKILCGFRRT